ncbi:MAG: ornithine cyclodeaminase family protein [Betaproteobacteria bacterium]|nr:MAG: ornithine cyclodeaminase family protein [Betaproteobacteria bacterium]
MAQQFIYLSADTLDGLGITARESRDCIEELVRGLDSEQVWAAPKSAMYIEDGRYFMATLAVATNPPVFAVKSLVLNAENLKRGLPQINGVVIVLDADTGLPLAIVDGNWVTAVRTAGLSAVAARHLAREDSAVIGFIGCGVQAHSHLAAFSELYPIREIRAFGRGTANRDKLCTSAEARGLTAIASRSGQEAIEDADIVVTSVTLSRETRPFLDAGGLKPGAFAAITDFAAPWHREGMRAVDRIVVDDVAQENASGAPMVEPDLIKGDLRMLVNGKTAGRSGPEETTAFVFRGLAIGDLALASLAWQKAHQVGAGTPIG